MIVSFSTIIYIRDPYAIFHNFKKNKITTNFRIQDYGLIKYEDFDSVALGTCHFTNLLKEDLDDAIKNSNFINLSAEGLTFYERYIILNYAFSKKKIKNVITTLDSYFDIANKIENTFYENLYLDSFKGKWEVYLNTNALKCVFFDKYCNYIDYDKNKMLFGITINTNIGFENFMKYGYYIVNKFINTNFYPLDTTYYKSIIDNEIIPIIKNHPETQFYYIIPTYNAIYWKIDTTKIDKFYKVISYLLKKTKNYNNVHFYWFYDESYPYNFDRYLELGHYDYKITLEQLNEIKNNSHIINYKNYKDKFEKFKKNINNFDIEYYRNKINSIKDDDKLQKN